MKHWLKTKKDIDLIIYCNVDIVIGSLFKSNLIELHPDIISLHNYRNTNNLHHLDDVEIIESVLNTEVSACTVCWDSLKTLKVVKTLNTRYIRVYTLGNRIY